MKGSLFALWTTSIECSRNHILLCHNHKKKNDKNKKKTTKELIDFGGAMEGQGVIACTAELSIMIHGIMYELQHNNNTTNDNEEVPPCQEIDQIIEAYSVYQ